MGGTYDGIHNPEAGREHQKEKEKAKGDFGGDTVFIGGGKKRFFPPANIRFFFGKKPSGGKKVAVWRENPAWPSRERAINNEPRRRQLPGRVYFLSFTFLSWKCHYTCPLLSDAIAGGSGRSSYGVS